MATIEVKIKLSEEDGEPKKKVIDSGQVGELVGDLSEKNPRVIIEVIDTAPPRE